MKNASIVGQNLSYASSAESFSMQKGRIKRSADQGAGKEQVAEISIYPFRIMDTNCLSG